MSNLCCFMQEEELAPQPGATPCWPPLTPPLLASVNGLRLVRGYLKRKSSKGGETTKWALRWLEVDPPEDDRPDYMLSVYKSAQKSKRLNAVSLKKITSVIHDHAVPCAFVVAVCDSSYTLLARDAADADTWVACLNAAREALDAGQAAQCVTS